MKKLVLLALIAFSFLAAHTPQTDNPLPQCDPCDWVR